MYTLIYMTLWYTNDNYIIMLLLYSRNIINNNCDLFIKLYFKMYIICSIQLNLN